MSAQPLTRTQNIFWTSFLLMLFLPLLGSTFSPLPFGIILPAIGAVYFIAHKIFFRTWPLVKTPLPGLLPIVTCLLALMFFSYFWSFNPPATFARAEKVGSLIVACFALVGVAQACPPQIWQKYNLMFPLAVFIIGAVNAFDIYFGLPIYQFINHAQDLQMKPDFLNKNVSVFVMALPVSLYLTWKSRSILAFMGLVVLAVSIFFLTFSQACQLSLLAILFGAIGSASFLEKITARTVFVGLVLLFLMLPFIAPTAFDLLAAKVSGDSGVLAEASTALRLENWDFLSRRIFENPWTGFGMDSTRYMKFDTQELYFHNNTIMHPHNAVLQMWIEYGVLGAAWSIGFLVYFYYFLKRLSPTARRLSFLTFSSIMVFLLVSWSIWASWLVALILYLATLCVLATKTETR